MSKYDQGSVRSEVSRLSVEGTTLLNSSRKHEVSNKANPTAMGCAVGSPEMGGRAGRKTTAAIRR